MSATLRPPVTDADHALGPEDAPVTLVEYGDFQCPHCGRAHPIVQALHRRLGDRLRVVFRNFPLTEIHPQALHAAQAAESVGARLGDDGYWRMHHAIFEHQRALRDRDLAGYAASAGADPEAVLQDLASGAHVERIEADFASGVRSGVNGTPTFFVNGVRFDGDWTDEEAFADALARAS